MATRTMAPSKTSGLVVKIVSKTNNFHCGTLTEVNLCAQYATCPSVAELYGTIDRPRHYGCEQSVKR